jgi:SAM-dependent methyltransferase
MASRAAAREIARGELNLAHCGNCGFIQNLSFDPEKLIYGKDYENAQHHSPAFRGHIESLVEYLLNERGIRNSRIVEVGCGDAFFLRKLVENPDTGNTGVGFDPSYHGPETGESERLRLERRYYDENCADVAADVVICRHVIEHVPDPVGLLLSVGKALERSPQAQVYFETPCVEWILASNAIWDFFYEHCSYFSARSLETAFERAGYQVKRVNHIFSGQYLWLEANKAENRVEVVSDAGSVPENAERFRLNEARILARLAQQMASITVDHRLAIWGAGAKGATFANLLDPQCTTIDCVIDINPNKQGHFVAGTGHPIVSPDQAHRRGVTAAFLMNPNYRTEIEKMLLDVGFDIRLLNVE